MRILSFLSLLLAVFSCNTPENKTEKHSPFTRLSPKDSGIDFENRLVDQKGFDVFRYRNYYNGGGIGIGDINNDGLADIYMVSNQGSNRLFLNKGDFKFEDITEAAGVAGGKPWSTGVAIADVNGDGWLDIYVCNSGDLKGNDRENELFINNYDGTFSERAAEFGLADKGFSTHAAFFDFDQDGDLDCYLLNNSFRPVSSLPIQNTRNERDELGGDKFYVNDDGKFRDTSEQMGIYGSVIGFGLGITLLDANNDSWTDIYVSNDFFERDYLYLNMNGKGFKESLEEYFDQISLFSMGADAADLNNDGHDEVFVTDMLPPEFERLKRTTSFENYNLQQLKLSRGFYNQFMKNTLQMNNGDGTFSEVGRYAGVSATDWSWGALMFDMDNDGYKEIFVSNGIYKDVTDQDFIEYFSSEENMKSALEGNEVNFQEFVNRMPSTPLPNAVFKRDSLGVYNNVSANWGLSEPSFSNGAAYGDLDNDGDLDLVVNNLNQQSFVYRNESEGDDTHYLRFILEGEGKNLFAVGAKINIYVGNQIISYNHFPTKGFQSSMDYVPVMGLGQVKMIDSLHVVWNASQETWLKNVSVDTTLKLSVLNAKTRGTKSSNSITTYFKQMPLNCEHIENDFVDFDVDKLMYHQLSREGPAIAVADVNGDGLDDFYFGGALGFEGFIYLNDGKDGFIKKSFRAFQENRMSEDVDAAFFDADGDGDMDLYVVSGGNEFGNNLEHFKDRLYINNTTKSSGLNFTLSKGGNIQSSGSCVKPADFDKDGDIDLFIGTRSISGEYGKPTSSYLLQNDGKGNFSNVTSRLASQLNGLGMVTDATWLDYDNDGDLDLFVVGEWMPIVLFENRGNFFQRKFNVEGLIRTEGWWNTIEAFDYNHDGIQDLIVGNLGYNSMFKATDEKPIRLYLGDFDKNGKTDPIYTFFKGGKYFPYHVRNDLSSQLSLIKKRAPSFKEYADKSIEEIFTEEELANTIKLNAYQMASIALINKGDGTFSKVILPGEVQWAPIFQIAKDDINGNSQPELILMGNFSGTKPEEGVYDANHGLILTWENGNWQTIPNQRSGLRVRGSVKSMKILKGKNSKLLVVGKNNEEAELYAYH